ncbi:MAG: CDC27 family protein [Promethearchaeota archaeon]
MALIEQNFRESWLSNQNKFHEDFVSLLNEDKFDLIVNICKILLKTQDPKNDTYTFVRKIIFDLINLDQSLFAVRLCKAYVKIWPSEALICSVIEEFLRYQNYSGALSALYFYVKTNSKYKILLVKKVLSKALEKDQEYPKIYNIIRVLLEINPLNKYVRDLIYNAIDSRNYQFALEVCKILLVKLKFKIDNTYFFLKIIFIANDNGQNLYALESCQEISKIYPDSSNIWFALGYSSMCMGKYKKALKAYYHALKFMSAKFFKKESKIWSYIGLTHVLMGEIKKAIGICKNNLKLRPKFEQSYYLFGLIHYKKGNLKKAVHFMKKALNLNHDYYHAWATLGQIHLKLYNYHEAFNACYSCLNINNQYVEGILLYKILFEEPVIDILSHSLPDIIKYGHRERLTQLDELVFPPEFMKKYSYLHYSKDFQQFLNKKRRSNSESIVAIYGQLPTCKHCNSILKLQSKSFNLKNGYNTLLYQCKKCGIETKKINYSENEPYIKIIAIVKSSLKERRVKLDHEKISIKFFTPKDVKEVIETHKNSKLLLKMKNSKLLYGQLIQGDNIKIANEEPKITENLLERAQDIENDNINNKHNLNKDPRNPLLFRGFRIKKKYSNNERILLRFFQGQTGIVPEQVINIRENIFFFVKKEDYFNARRNLTRIRRHLGTKARIIRMETSLLRLLVAFFPDLHIHEIKAEFENGTNTIHITICFLYDKERRTTLGPNREYNKVVSEIFSKYISWDNIIKIRFLNFQL